MRSRALPDHGTTPNRGRGCSSLGTGLVWVWLALSLLWCWPAAAQPALGAPSKALEQIRKRGVVHVGVKTDFPPYGQITPQGQAEGYEVDLAHALARRLGVDVNIVSVTTENRFQRLEQGDIDVMIATAADTRERRQIATAIEPSYYSGGVTVLLRPGQKIVDWQGLRGQKLCATQGAYFNRPASQRYLLELDIYRNTRDAFLALKEGHCIGYLYSRPAIQSYLKKPEWAGYTMLSPETMLAPWSIYLARKEADSEFAYLLGDIVADWHRSGYLLEREAVWGISPSKFLHEEQARWSHQKVDGSYTCTRNAQGQWPVACLNLEFVRPEQAGGLLAVGLWIRDLTGLNLTFVYDSYDRRLLVKGLLYTVALMAGAVFFSLVVGMLLALAVESGGRVLRPCMRWAATYGRMTPPLLMMYLVFFGVGSVLSARFGVTLSPLWVAIGCMAYYTGTSIMTVLLDTANHLRERQPEFRLAFHNVMHLVDLAAGPVKASLTNVLKQSVMASAIAVPEILSAAVSIMSDQGNDHVMMNVFLFTIVLLIILWERVFDWIERAAHRKAGTPHG